MKRQLKILVFVATTAALSSFNSAQAGGCGRGGVSFGGGGIRIGFGGGQISIPSQHTHSSPVYNYPSHSHSAPSYSSSHSQPYSQPYSQQPVYSQPSYPQHVYSQPSMSSEVIYASNVVPQSSTVMHQSPQVPPMNSQPVHVQNSSTSNPGMIQSNGHQATSSQNMAVQNLNSQNVANQNGMPQNGMPLNGINGQPSQGQVTNNQQQIAGSNQATSRPVAMNSTTNVGQQTNVNPVQPLTAPNNAGSPSNAGSSELSALQMLASLNGDVGTTAASIETTLPAELPEFAPAAVPSTNVHVGNWQVVLPGNQTITLALNGDNSFQWNAVKEGKASSFQGQYRIETGRLTLVRSNDLQQMSGSWSGEGSNFTFKLDGATTSGLAFVRAQ